MRRLQLRWLRLPPASSSPQDCSGILSVPVAMHSAVSGTLPLAGASWGWDARRPHSEGKAMGKGWAWRKRAVPRREGRVLGRGVGHEGVPAARQGGTQGSLCLGLRSGAHPWS